MAELTVVVVDDHPLWRETLVTLLAGIGVAATVHQAADGETAIELARAVRPDVVLMDMQMPGIGGVEATAAIRSDPGCPVLMLCSSDQRRDVLEAVRAGASGYLLKTTGGPEIADALRRVHAGELVFPREVASHVRDVLAGRAVAGDDPLAALTDRERSVLGEMARGLSNQAIGERLFMSPKTVEAHIGTIFGKLGLADAPYAHRRVQAVVAYLRAMAER